jgi:uncharacterized protein YbjT (DUF2867 family)
MILVTGARGNVGRHVVSGLLAEGARVRALTRDPPSGRWPAGIEVVRGDLSDATTLAAALDDVDAVFLLWRTVQELIGSPAGTFREWATDRADDFR